MPPKKGNNKNKMNDVVKTTYHSKPVAVPPTFLRGPPPPDARPVVCTTIDFAQTVLPEYKGAHAIVLDHVISPSECAELIRLAEESVREEDYTYPEEEEESGKNGEGGRGKGDPWQPARVNVGPGLEVFMPEYRRGDRIIWDEQEVVDRLWERIARGIPGVMDDDDDTTTTTTTTTKDDNKYAHVLCGFNEDDLVGGYKKRDAKRVVEWTFRRVNKRMRFLRYHAGDFFRPHCDGQYGEPGPDGEVLRTWFTVHLYLNDSRDGLKEVPGDDAEGGGKSQGGDGGDKGEEMLVGGATEFLSSDEKRKVDVHPRAGRVLIFQHRRLYHSGADVVQGTKYTVRTDVLFEMKESEEVEEEE